MFIRLILAISVLIALYILYKKNQKKPVQERKKSAISLIIYIIIGLILLAALTGHVHWLGAIAASIAGIFRFGSGRILQFLPLLNIVRQHSTFKNPSFKSIYLTLEWDIKTGATAGEVTDGNHKGKALHDLSPAQIDELLAFYQDNDKKSYYLLSFYLQKNSRGQQYSNNNTYQAPDNNQGLSTEEASRILGVDSNATNAQINTAYKRLIQKLHPDRGGSEYLASRVNLARDTLLNKTR